jgi:hypothetical protein
MFLRDLGFAVDRLDWWNIPNELTAFELAVHRAQWELKPIGDDRADMGRAWQAIVIAQSNMPKPMTSDQLEQIWNLLTRYTPYHVEQKKTPTPDEAAQQGKAAFAAVGIRS